MADTNPPVTQAEGKDPSGFLSEIINSAVTVKLNSGVVYKGTSSSFSSSLSPSPIYLIYLRYARSLRAHTMKAGDLVPHQYSYKRRTAILPFNIGP